MATAKDDSKVPTTAFKITKKLTLPVMKFEMEKARYAKILTPMKLGQQLKGTGEKSRMEPATVCGVVDVQTGEQMQLICSAIIKSVLTENYPDDSYVGVSFQIIKHNKRENKQYYDYSIDEIETPPAGR